MEAHTTTKLAVMAMVLLIIGVANANNEHAICGMSTDDLFTCRPAVIGPASLPPSAACCAALEKADLSCLCTFKNNKVLPALGIDPAQAMQLPAKCNILQSFHC
ncbi:hypothetical protein Salat_0113600 [Sesamum alatum]|uniref:Bifunctional inhibitor/plant lipid transfer protein/seed storage helical domain-containing protein n=1 Tax=Sesamum alatum TaxID=300844 RepID=A0AAE2CX17_9LAMI|nr:hypothetical protein Salat_0113600 [Sesamum alatum]